MRFYWLVAIPVVFGLSTSVAAASSATLHLSVSAAVDTGGKSYAPPAINLNAAVVQFNTVNLSAGNTTVNPPGGTTAIVVVVPPTSATVTIKGIAGDTGIPLSLSATDTRWFVLPIATTFLVNASAPVSGIEVFYL